MSSSLEWIAPHVAAVRGRIDGERASDGQPVEDCIAVEVTENGDGVIFIGSRETLIELSARIMEAAILAHTRHESQLRNVPE